MGLENFVNFFASCGSVFSHRKCVTLSVCGELNRYKHYYGETSQCNTVTGVHCCGNLQDLNVEYFLFFFRTEFKVHLALVHCDSIKARGVSIRPRGKHSKFL